MIIGRRARPVVALSGRRGGRPGLALVVTLCCVAPSAASVAAQTPSERLARLEARFEEARAAAVHLLAPRAFGTAADRLEDARREVRRGSDAGTRVLSAAGDALDAATAAADGSRTRFRDPLAARDRARAEDAAARASEAWRAAEEELARAGRDAERGDTGGLAERVVRATELYRRAGRAARTDRLLGPAEDARQVALSAGASELAPASFAAGEAALARARAALDAEGDDEAVETPAAAGRRAFERAARIAMLADSVVRRQLPVERLIEAHEADLSRLLAAAGIGGEALTRDTEAATDTLAAFIDGLRRDNQRLAGRLEDERATSGQLADRVGVLENELAESEQRFEDTRGRLAERQERDARLRETQALFGPEEGDVILNGDRLVLRLYGLTFASGSSDVVDSQAPLLTKVQRVLREYPNAPVRIEGHTDSQGGAEANRVLSQRRAIAIREYLLARLPISSSRIEAVGMGEDQPIASNDDEEGRRRNRRIEIILTLTDG